MNELRERVLCDYQPARVSRITGLDPDEIEHLPREYARTQPAAIRVNYGLQRHYGGAMAVRTIGCLPPVAGAQRAGMGSAGVLASN